MTFSICVREEYERDGEDHRRFGVAVTTRLPAVGTMCPFASENAAVATQSRVNVDLGRRGVEYADDGLAVEDALAALLEADEGRAERQLHGVDADGTFAFSGEECGPWYGHVEGGGYTVAGNLLVGEAVVEETAAAYETARPDGGEDGDAPPLAERLVDALAAGHEVGGDKREDLAVQSAALVVRSTEDDEERPLYDDLRVDASENPVADLRQTYETARRGWETLVERSDGEESDGDATDGE